MNRSWLAPVASSLFLVLIFGINAASAQTRMSDKDVENTLKNMHDDAKKFRSSFNSAVGKSTIRNTDQEKQARNLVEEFEKQTDQAGDRFDKNKNADPGLATLRTAADQIDQVLTTTPMSSVTEQWLRVKTELAALSAAYGMGGRTAAN